VTLGLGIIIGHEKLMNCKQGGKIGEVYNKPSFYMAYASLDRHKDFISLLSLSNIGVNIEPELVLAQKKQAPSQPSIPEQHCTQNGLGCTNGYGLPTAMNDDLGMNGPGKRRRGQLEYLCPEAAEEDCGWGVSECPTKVSVVFWRESIKGLYEYPESGG
jgi:hypothetical protein